MLFDAGYLTALTQIIAWWRTRRLATADGGEMVEPLMAFSEPERSYSYAIVQGPVPVTDYIGTVRVYPLAGQDDAAEVVWSARFTPAGGAAEREVVEQFAGRPRRPGSAGPGSRLTPGRTQREHTSGASRRLAPECASSGENHDPDSISKESSMPDFVPPPKNNDSPFADMHGHHVAVRTPSLEEAKDFYVGKLDFRIIREWDYGDEKLAYLAAPADDGFYIEVLGGGDTPPTDLRPYTTLADSLNYGGFHHFCVHVDNVDATLAKLRERGIKVVEEPFVLPAITRKLAFFADPFGNLIELSEILD